MSVIPLGLILQVKLNLHLKAIMSKVTLDMLRVKPNFIDERHSIDVP